MPWTWLALAGVASSTAAAVWGKTQGPRLAHLVAKPLIVLVLIGRAELDTTILAPAPQAWLLGALAFSLLGDLVLMGSNKQLPLGLVSFLLAHVAYVVCFTLEVPFAWAQLVWLPLVSAVGIWGVAGAWAHFGKLRPAVVVYVVAIIMTAFRLAARFDARAELGLWRVGVGALGGIVFMIADGLLARRRFAKQAIPYTIELGTYALAQLCIVESVAGGVAQH